MKNKIILLSCFALVLHFFYPSRSEGTYYVVCIDPGHGGSDSATVGPVYGVREKNANLTVALALKSKIEYYIYPVYMTRTIDTTILNDVRTERKHLQTF
jgi:N-acetylmuramoyl-L-alanine amidase